MYEQYFFVCRYFMRKSQKTFRTCRRRFAPAEDVSHLQKMFRFPEICRRDFSGKLDFPRAAVSFSTQDIGNRTPGRQGATAAGMACILEPTAALTILANVATAQVAPPTVPRRVRRPRSVRCGACTACASLSDCGWCKECLDKPRFGGQGVRKRACEFRMCASPRRCAVLEKN